jgi:type III secretory pathway component EscS
MLQPIEKSFHFLIYFIVTTMKLVILDEFMGIEIINYTPSFIQMQHFYI